jgi:4'-phosphopantetheinyl transferase
VFELAENEVHLWFAYPDEWRETALTAAARTILDAGEIARSERFRFPEHRRLFLVSRLLLREALSRYAESPPGAWRFIANEHGKPRIAPDAGPSAPAFNLAHTAGVAVVALTRGRDVGVDVENGNRRVHARRLIERFFSPEEVAELGNLSSADLQERFFLSWTLKEAYIKALGLGLAQPLDSFAFHLKGERPRRIDFSAGLPHDPHDLQDWRFAVVAPRPHFVAALCAAAERTESVGLRFYRAFPAGGVASLVCDPLGLSTGWDLS